MKRKLSKLLALLMAMALLAICLTACGEEPAPSTESEAPAEETPDGGADEEITITFWHTYGDSEEAQFLNEVLPLWEAEHPNIHIEAVRQDSSQYHQMIVTSFGTA